MTTRKQILDILSTGGEATIDEIAASLRSRSGKSVSTVTIRYHLNVLLREGRVTEPRTVPRTTRGRPQHVFAVSRTDKGRGNSGELLSFLLVALAKEQRDDLQQLFQRVVEMMRSAANVSSTAPVHVRLAASAEFLNRRGYEATVEQVVGGHILNTRYCPYHDVIPRTDILCSLDMQIIEAIVAQPIQRLTRLADGDGVCSYFIEEKS